MRGKTERTEKMGRGGGGNAAQEICVYNCAWRENDVVPRCVLIIVGTVPTLHKTDAAPDRD